MATRIGTLKLVTYRGAPYMKLYLKDHSVAEPTFEPLLGGNFFTRPVQKIEFVEGREYTIKWEYYFLDKETLVPLDPPTSLNNEINFVVPESS